jgi:CheY-like chemotaxis protein
MNQPLPSTPLVPGPQPGWIFVLSRSQHIRDLLLLVLRQEGYAVEGAATLAEAAPLFSTQGTPSVILLDGGATSDENLHARLEQIAALLPKGGPCPVIVLSVAHPLPRPERLPGIVSILPTPLDLRTLLELVAAQRHVTAHPRPAAEEAGREGS